MQIFNISASLSSRPPACENVSSDHCWDVCASTASCWLSRFCLFVCLLILSRLIMVFHYATHTYTHRRPKNGIQFPPSKRTISSNAAGIAHTTYQTRYTRKGRAKASNHMDTHTHTHSRTHGGRSGVASWQMFSNHTLSQKCPPSHRNVHPPPIASLHFKPPTDTTNSVKQPA